MIEKKFSCSLCGKPAMTILLLPAGVAHPRSGSKAIEDLCIVDPLPADESQPAVVVESFLCNSRVPLDLEQFAKVQAALERNDFPALRRMDDACAPSYCQDCDCHYCGDHWYTRVQMADDYPGFYDCTYGTCPQGHSQILDD
jgi:hypothetical protein